MTRKQEIDDLIAAHLGWAKGKALYFQRRYRLDFDDVYSYALEAVWHALIYQRTVEDGCSRDLKWFATVFLRRRVIDLVRLLRTRTLGLPRQPTDFANVGASSVTFLTAYSSPFEPREPCLACGTTGGLPRAGRTCSARCLGLCLSCYQKRYKTHGPSQFRSRLQPQSGPSSAKQTPTDRPCCSPGRPRGARSVPQADHG